MSQLTHFKKRIKAVQKTQKITKAMRLSAMSFYSRLERQRVAIEKYRAIVSHIIGQLQNDNVTFPSAFAPEELLDTRPLVIVCSSTKSLCGGLNNALLRLFDSKFIIEADQKPSFIGIGRKAVTLLHTKQLGKIVYEVEEYNDRELESIALAITEIIWNAKPVYTSVRCYTTRLKNFFVQLPQEQYILPLSLTQEKTGFLPAGSEYLYEQDKQKIAHKVAHHFLYTSILETLFHSFISENAARFIAMDQSTNNAERCLETLTLSYNKSRQSLITREIAELANNLE